MSLDSAAPLADIHHSLVGDVVIVTVSGELDLSNHLRFAALALPPADDASHVILNLTGVEFIDLPALGVVARLRKDLARRGLPLHVVPSQRVRRLLQLGGLSHGLRLHPTIGDAMAATSGPLPESA